MKAKFPEEPNRRNKIGQKRGPSKWGSQKKSKRKSGIVGSKINVARAIKIDSGHPRPLHHIHRSFLTLSAPPQAFRRGPGKGCRLFDRTQASFAFRPRDGQRSACCPKLKAGKHYEAREGVPAGLVRPATERVSRQKHVSGGQGTLPFHPVHRSFLNSHSRKIKRNLCFNFHDCGFWSIGHDGLNPLIP